MPRLIIRGNDGEEVFDMIEDEVVIGRAKENILFIDDDGLSREHCKILVDGDSYRVEDLGSKNGTLVNASRVKSHRLRGGDLIGICAVDIEFQWLPGEREKYEEELDEDEDVMEASAVSSDDSDEDALEAISSTQVKQKRFTLSLMSESQSFEEHCFDGETLTIGRRSDRTIQIKDEAASGNHAKLVPDADGYLLVDEDSRNGTYVKSDKVTRYPLKSGDVIRIGKTELRFIDHENPPAAEESEIKRKPSRETNGKAHSDDVPVCNGDTRELPRAEDVEQWSAARVRRDSEEDDDLDNLFGDGSTTETNGKSEKGALATKAGPVTRMSRRSADKQDEIEEDEEEEYETDGEEVVVQRKPKPHPRPKPVRASHKKTHRQRGPSVLPTIFASLVALAIVVGAGYLLFGNRKTSNVTKVTRSNTSTQTDSSTRKLPIGDGAPEAPSEAQVGMWKSPLPALPEFEGVQLATTDTSGTGQNNPDMTSTGEPVIRARPLNSTKRGSDYSGILSDLIQDVAQQNKEAALGDADSEHLSRAKEMIRDFKLSFARRELQAMEKKEWEYNSALEQLKIISSIISHLDSTFASGKAKVTLKRVAPSVKKDGTLVGASATGVMFRNDAGEPEEIGWTLLKPNEKYALAQRCYSKTDAAGRAKLGILCLNLGLPRDARLEFQAAEKLGFEDIDQYRALLEREPDSL